MSSKRNSLRPSNSAKSGSNNVSSKMRRVSISSNSSVVSISSTDSGIESSFPTRKLKYSFSDSVTEKKKQPIYSVEFNYFLKPNQPKLFAATAGSQISIYECTSNGKIKLRSCFEDPDKKESFWTCCWTVLGGKSLLVTGGERGVIRIIQADEIEHNHKYLVGHGQAINQASASKDHSIRLWNIETLVCIVSFHGNDAHRDQVLSVDFNRYCTKLVSGGMDHKICIWDLTVTEIQTAINESVTFNGRIEKRSFKTILYSEPIFFSRQLHSDYIDCVQWFHDFIISKSKENDFFCWVPGTLAKYGRVNQDKDDHFTEINRFKIENCEYFFIHFATDLDMSMAALGNQIGEVKIWLLDANHHNLPFNILKHPKCKSVVRDLTFSRSGRELVFCCDDGSIWLWRL